MTNKSTTMNQCSIARRILEVQDIKVFFSSLCTFVSISYYDRPVICVVKATQAMLSLKEKKRWVLIKSRFPKVQNR